MARSHIPRSILASKRFAVNPLDRIPFHASDNRAALAKGVRGDFNSWIVARDMDQGIWTVSAVHCLIAPTVCVLKGSPCL